MEYRQIRGTLAGVLIALVLVTADAMAQDGPKPRPGQAFTTWLADQPTRPGAGSLLDPTMMVRAVKVRNDTTVPLAFTSVTFNKCRNIVPTCGLVTIPTVVVAPGGTRVVMQVAPADDGKSYRFDYQLERRVATECLTPPALTPGDTSRFRPPLSGTMWIPPMDKIRGKGTVTVQFFVAPSGLVDSVAITGLQRPSDVAVLTASVKQWQYGPATQDGCPVPGVSTITMTFGTRRSTD